MSSRAWEPGTVLQDLWGSQQWIVCLHDPIFPDREGPFLLYRHANLLSRGDRMALKHARPMKAIGTVKSMGLKLQLEDKWGW